MATVARCVLDVAGSIVGSVTGVVDGIISITNNGPYPLFPPPPSDVFTTPPLKVKEPYCPDDISTATDPVMAPTPSSVERARTWGGDQSASSAQPSGLPRKEAPQSFQKPITHFSLLIYFLIFRYLLTRTAQKQADLEAIDDLYLVGWGGGGASFKRRDSKKL